MTRKETVQEQLSDLSNDGLQVPKMKIFQWFTEPQFYLVGLVYISARIFFVISQAYISFYLQYAVSLPSKYMAIIPLVMYIAGFVVSILLRLVTNRFGLKRTFVLFCCLGLGTKTICC